jgi:7-carboxy-7-deazaguanine synthase (Cx14CxxC type)
MTYSVKEIYYTLQGEGAQTGRAAVFLRFSGCNLWSGLERDRAAATCTFCDTDFVGTDGPGGGKFADADALAARVAREWNSAAIPAHSRESGNPGDWVPAFAGTSGREIASAKPYVVCTGGEPLLQLDAPLIDALHARGFEIGVETNGTIEAPEGVDWLCVSPKADAPLAQKSGDELKLVFPQEKASPEQFEHLNFRHFFLQPMDGPDLARHTQAAVAYCKTHPKWRLSLQTHKLIGIP